MGKTNLTQAARAYISAPVRLVGPVPCSRQLVGDEAGFSATLRSGIMLYYPTKEKLTWRQNADTAVRQATGTDACTAQTVFTSIAMTRSTANGADRQVTATDACTVQIDCIGTVPAATSASGAARRPMARAVSTPRRAATRNDACMTFFTVDQDPSWGQTLLPMMISYVP